MLHHQTIHPATGNPGRRRLIPRAETTPHHPAHTYRVRRSAFAVFAALLASALPLSISTAAAATTAIAAPRAGQEAPVFAAIRDGNPGTVRRLIQEGNVLETRDSLGNTPLLAAAAQGNLETLRLLVRAGARLDATNLAGATALMRAATDEAKARLLIEAGANVLPRSAAGNTALLLAARRAGNTRTVRRLLDRGAAAETTNAFGSSPLMAAAAANDLATVRLLLERGARVDGRPNMDGDGFIWGGGRTPLQWAAFHGNVAMIDLLLARGAAPDQFTLVGGPLTQAAWAGQVDAARRLIDAGAPVDQRDLVANYSPLHWAASSEHASADLVRLLLNRGADAQAEGGQPVDNFLGEIQTPLKLAARRGTNTAIVRALLEAGAGLAPGATPVATPPSPAATGPLQAPAGSNRDSVVHAIARALPPLQRTATESAATFRRHASRQQCVSCHQQQLPMAAVALAGSRGFVTDRQTIDDQLEMMTQFASSTPVTPADGRLTALEASWQATFHPEAAIFNGYATFLYDLAQRPATSVTDSMVHQLLVLQHSDGHWSWNLPRPPIQASDIQATALAVHSLRHYPIPARKAEIDQALARARDWLSRARSETTEEQAHQILGLAWSGAAPSRLKTTAKGLLAQQRPDGGWAQLTGLESDAYGTGLALYALLATEALAPEAPAARRAIGHLTLTQRPDGSWHVRRRAHPFQPPMDPGFPHGADGWISAAGTAWASLALAASLPPARRIDSTPAPSFPVASAPAGTTALANRIGRPAQPTAPEAPLETAIDFARDIQPVLERSCVACHQGERPKGGFAATDRASFVRGGARGEPAILPGNPAQSLLPRLLADEVTDLEMPPVGQRHRFPGLTPAEQATFRAWIRQGAPWPASAHLATPAPPQRPGHAARPPQAASVTPGAASTTPTAGTP